MTDPIYIVTITDWSIYIVTTTDWSIYIVTIIDWSIYIVTIWNVARILSASTVQMTQL